MNLLLKRQHKQYTIASTVVLLPAFLTVLSLIFSILFSTMIANRALIFVLQLPMWVKFICWLVLPVISFQTAKAAQNRGSILRYRKWNLWIKRLASAFLTLLVLLAVLSYIGVSLF